MKLPKSIRLLLDSHDSTNHYLVKEMITHMDITMHDVVYYMVFESKNWKYTIPIYDGRCPFFTKNIFNIHLTCKWNSKLYTPYRFNIKIHNNYKYFMYFKYFPTAENECMAKHEQERCINKIIKEIEN